MASRSLRQLRQRISLRTPNPHNPFTSGDLFLGSVTTKDSTTVFRDSKISWGANDEYNGGEVTFHVSATAVETGNITDFDTATKAYTVNPATTLAAVGNVTEMRNFNRQGWRRMAIESYIGDALTNLEGVGFITQVGTQFTYAPGMGELWIPDSDAEGDSALDYISRVEYTHSQPITSTWSEQVVGEWEISSAGYDNLAQEFHNVRADYCTGVRLYLQRDGSPSDTLTCNLRKTTVTGTVVATATLAAAAVAKTPQFATFAFDSPVILEANTDYFVELTSGGAMDGTDNVQWLSTSGATRTLRYNDGAWQTAADEILMFVATPLAQAWRELGPADWDLSGRSLLLYPRAALWDGWPVQLRVTGYSAVPRLTTESSTLANGPAQDYVIAYAVTACLEEKAEMGAMIGHWNQRMQIAYRGAMTRRESNTRQVLT